MHHLLHPAQKIYFRFPLGSLAYAPKDPDKTINAALDYCLYDVGSKLRKQLLEEFPSVRDLQRVVKEASQKTYDQVIKKNELELSVALGAIKLSVSIGSGTESILETRNNLSGFLEQQDLSSQRNMTTVTNDVFWGCFYYLAGNPKESWLDWNEFRVLCAIASKIGAAKFAKCSWAEIQARAAGWCGKATMAKANEAEKTRRGPLIMSRTTIRRHLANLEATRRFACFKHGRGNKFGESWYSFSMGQDDLQKVVLSRKSRKVDTIATQRRQDAEASSRWRDNRQPPCFGRGTNHH